MAMAGRWSGGEDGHRSNGAGVRVERAQKVLPCVATAQPEHAAQSADACNVHNATCCGPHNTQCNMLRPIQYPMQHAAAHTIHNHPTDLRAHFVCRVDGR